MPHHVDAAISGRNANHLSSSPLHFAPSPSLSSPSLADVAYDIHNHAQRHVQDLNGLARPFGPANLSLSLLHAQILEYLVRSKWRQWRYFPGRSRSASLTNRRSPGIVHVRELAIGHFPSDTARLPQRSTLPTSFLRLLHHQRRLNTTPSPLHDAFQRGQMLGRDARRPKKWIAEAFTSTSPTCPKRPFVSYSSVLKYGDTGT